MDADDDFQEELHGFLDRLVKAGWASGWVVDTQGTIRAEWIDDGAEKFGDFCAYLSELGGQRAVPEQAQTMAILLWREGLAD